MISGEALEIKVEATLGLVLGGSTSYLLLDETGCIWYWSAHSWAYYWFPIPPPSGSTYYVPKYFRTASYTLWDNLGMGNP